MSTGSVGVPNQARPLSNAPIGIPEGLDQRHRAALEQHPVTRDEQPLGREGGGVVLDQVQAVGLERVDVGGAERGQQVVAHRAGEAGEREPLEAWPKRHPPSSSPHP